MYLLNTYECKYLHLINVRMAHCAGVGVGVQTNPNLVLGDTEHTCVPPFACPTITLCKLLEHLLYAIFTVLKPSQADAVAIPEGRHPQAPEALQPWPLLRNLH